MKLKLLQVKEASGEVIDSPEAVIKIMEIEAKADRECFWILHLSGSHRLIEKGLVSMGTVNASLIHPREVFKKAILKGSKAIITVHNHPGGSANPSPQDIEIWARIDQSGELLCIGVLDHLTITPSGAFYSKVQGGIYND